MLLSFSGVRVRFLLYTVSLSPLNHHVFPRQSKILTPFLKEEQQWKKYVMYFGILFMQYKK
jgi:hypothetical protein